MRILKESGAAVKVEPTYLSLGITPHSFSRYYSSSHSRPGSLGSLQRRMGPDGWINFMEDQDGATTTFDITHSYPLGGNDLQKEDRARDDEHQIKEREKEKRKVYADLIAQGPGRKISFVPLVSLTHGRWNMETKKILQRSAESWMRRQGVPENTGSWNKLKSTLMTQWWQELSAQLQKGNLRVLQGQYSKAFRGTRDPREHPGRDIRTLHVSDATQRTISSITAHIPSQATSTTIGSILQAMPISS